MMTPFNIVWTGEQYRVSIPNYDGGTVVTMEDHEAALEAKEQEINKLTKECEKWRNKAWDYEEEVEDLMKQAVRFASALRNDRMDQWCELMILDPDAPATVDVVAKQDADFRAATAFLASPEVQAWRKEQG